MLAPGGPQRGRGPFLAVYRVDGFCQRVSVISSADPRHVYDRCSGFNFSPDDLIFPVYKVDRLC